MAPGVRLPGDDCDRDWIWDRQVETAAPAEIRGLAEKAWESQSRRLLEVSPFYARKFGEAGAGSTPPRLAELSRLPFSTKDELRQAIEEAPPFGSNAGVPADRIKRVYQTSGTTGVPSLIALSAADVETWTAIGSRTYYASGIHDHHSALSTFGVNIQSMATKTYSAPVSGTPLFQLDADLAVPTRTNINELRERLDQLQRDENIDIELEPSKF